MPGVPFGAEIVWGRVRANFLGAKDVSMCAMIFAEMWVYDYRISPFLNGV